MSSNIKEIASYWSAGAGAVVLQEVTDMYRACGKDPVRTVLRAKKQAASDLPGPDLELAVQIISGRERMTRAGLSWADHGLFLDKQLQQSTSPRIAEHHANRFSQCRCVVDLCCGLGFDSAALASRVPRLFCVEADPVTAAFAAHNLELCGYTNYTVLCMTAEDFLQSPDASECDGIWVDPDRRAGGSGRMHAGSEYSPSLDTLLALEFSGCMGIKVAPVFDAGSLRDAVSIEIIGYQRECKEQVLWRAAGMPALQVSIVDQGFSWQAPEELQDIDSVTELVSGSFILEPHNALRQSQRLADFFADIGAAPVRGVPLGFAAEPSPCPAVVSFEVLEVCTYRPKEVSRMLKNLEWVDGTTIKKCGVSESAEQIQRQVRFSKEGANDPERVLFVIGIGRKKVAAFCRRCKQSPDHSGMNV